MGNTAVETLPASGGSPDRLARKVHPTVQLDYLVRGCTFPFSAITLLFTFRSLGETPIWLILLIATYGILWPQAARIWARRSPDSKRFEQGNLVADALFIGAWSAGIQYALWPSFMLFIAIHMGTISVGGLQLAMRALLVALISLIGVGLLLDVSPQFAAAPLPAGLSIFGCFFYMSVFAWHSHVQSKRNLRDRKLLETRNREIEAKSRELAAARDAAEEANRSKSLFLANMSHELRTPLNAVIGYSDLLIEEAEDEGDTHLVPDLEKIRTAGKHLLGLINEVLDLSKIEAGKMELVLEDVPLDSLVAEVRSTIEPLAAQHGNRLEVECNTDHSLQTDATKLRQVLFNLLGNACKFTEDGVVRLRVHDQRAEGRTWLIFDVEDSGIGMTPEQQSRVFEPFVQAESSTARRFGGTGLGLTLCLRFARLLGGDIALRSEAGAGSRFRVRIPADGPASTADVEPGGQDHSDQGASIVVIDDDAAGAEVVCRMLAREGHRAVPAASGEEGLELARKLRPQLILLDVLMPSVDGWSVLGRIKADPELEDIPVVMISIADNREVGLALGAADYLLKPVKQDVLAASLRKQLGDTHEASVLVIDDDDTTRSMLRRMLARQGWTVAEARNGHEGLARLEQARPALILLDLMMPEMDGLAFLEALENRDGDAPPVIVLTAKTLTQAEQQHLQGHVQKVLEKGSYSGRQLEAIVRRAIEQCEETA